MRALNKQAARVMDQLLQELGEGDHVKIDRGGAGIMAVVVEKLETSSLGVHYSVAHYYVQEGDLMRDPEMIFIRRVDGSYYPSYYLQDNMGIEQNSIFFDEAGRVMVKPKMQADHATFANTWMMNIKEQQKL